MDGAGATARLTPEPLRPTYDRRRKGAQLRRARNWLTWFAIGASLLGVTKLAAASAPRQGGTLRIATPLDSVDPAVAYSSADWMLEFATCAKLYNYPDAPAPAGLNARPEVASDFPKLSADGKTQTIRLKHTFRFSDGRPVTSANFVAALNRDANPNLQSGAEAYLHEIVGADAVIAGKAQTISGVTAVGAYGLQIRTTRPVPDLVSRLAMPFFCPIAVATPSREIDDPLGSGPYYVADFVATAQRAVLMRNPFYRGSRPANLAQIVVSYVGGREACKVAVDQDLEDLCSFTPTTDRPEIVAKYGVNRNDGRFFFEPTHGLAYFAFNHDRPAFHGPGQIPLAQAINWAIDRHALVQAAGYLSGKRTAQILPPAMARPTHLYPVGGVSAHSLAKARALLETARFKPRRLVLDTADVGFEPAWAQILQFNLKRLGIDVQINVIPFATYDDQIGKRHAPFDIAIGVWTLDYDDPYAIFGPLLNGRDLTQDGNQNVAYFDVPRYDREIERLEEMTGDTRSAAWAALDSKMMRDDPPWAPVMVPAEDDYLSQSYGCYLFQPAVAEPDISTACKR